MSKYNIKDMDLFLARQREGNRVLEQALEAMKRGEPLSNLDNAHGRPVNQHAHSNVDDAPPQPVYYVDYSNPHHNGYHTQQQYYQAYQHRALFGEDNQDQGCCCVIS